MTKAVAEQDSAPAGQGTLRRGTEDKIIRVLLVEDEPLYAKMVTRRMVDTRSKDLAVVHVESLQDALNHLTMDMTDVVLLDLMLPDSSGMDTLVRVREARPTLPVVVLTGQGSQDLAVAALKSGAQDYLIKGSDEGLMVRSIRYALERCKAWQALRESEERLRSTRLQLMQMDKMDSIVGRLAAGIAHEVRNPLSTIQMGIAFLRNFCGDLPDDVVETLEDMDHAMERAYGIIQGLLDFCVPAELQLEEESLNTCVCQIMPMFRHEIGKRGIEFVPNLYGDLPKMMLDRNQIKQVLLHLIINAIDAMPHGGRLTVSTQTYALWGDEAESGGGSRDGGAGRVVVVEIDDSGDGIPDSVMENIYDPFFTTKPVGEGTGLGLSISKNIIELHGGKLELINRPEGGVRAAVTFVL